MQASVPRRPGALALGWTLVLVGWVLVEMRRQAGDLEWWLALLGVAPVGLVTLAPLASLLLLLAPMWVLTLRGTDEFAFAQLAALITATYAAGLMLPRRSAVLAGGAAVVTAVANSTRVADPGAGDVVFPVLLVGGPWVAGRVHRTWRERAEELRRLGEDLAASREEAARLAVVAERGAIARELHDTLAQSLQVVIVNAEAAQEALGTSRDLAGEAVARIATEARHALDEARRAVGALRVDPSAPASGDSATGGAGDGAPGMARLPELVDALRPTGLDVDLDVAGVGDDLPAAVSAAVYRLVQESLTNVVKHSAARRARVAVLRQGTTVTVDVCDDGGPPSVHGVPPARDGGFGVRGMRERAELLGGHLEAGPHGGGFRVHATLPVGTGQP